MEYPEQLDNVVESQDVQDNGVFLFDSNFRIDAAAMEHWHPAYRISEPPEVEQPRD